MNPVLLRVFAPAQFVIISETEMPRVLSLESMEKLANDCDHGKNLPSIDQFSLDYGGRTLPISIIPKHLEHLESTNEGILAYLRRLAFAGLMLDHFKCQSDEFLSGEQVVQMGQEITEKLVPGFVAKLLEDGAPAALLIDALRTAVEQAHKHTQCDCVQTRLEKLVQLTHLASVLKREKKPKYVN